jgi:hypothetical protein
MKTPQEKKRLSYAKDRRNTYGEHDKGSRKTIRANKLHQRRTERRVQNNALNALPNTTGLDELTTAENAIKTTIPRQWRKSPDQPLGKVVPWRLASRIATVGARQARRKQNDS